MIVLSDNRELYETCQSYPAIDNHAHPLLTKEHRDTIPFESITSEAPEGPAMMRDAIQTLASFRATRQLAKLYGMPGEDVSWEEVKGHRPPAFLWEHHVRECFVKSNIQCLLIDRGLPRADEIGHKVEWHDQFTKAPSKTIVRIEKTAEQILGVLVSKYPNDLPATLLDEFSRLFERSLRVFASDLVAFKSIACYRTGLAIPPPGSVLIAQINKSLRDGLKECRGKPIRMAWKEFNDYCVRLALKVCADFDKPLQFHTGLGDPDLTLSLASPAHLQPLIRFYSESQTQKPKIVLLHAGYPYTREAGYLAAMYEDVYLDMGEVCPQVSAKGQKVVWEQALELCPGNKLLWSTDGHWHPETYYLSSVQSRDALYEVLSESVTREELPVKTAVSLAKAILFENSNRLYKLGLRPEWKWTNDQK